MTKRAKAALELFAVAVIAALITFYIGRPAYYVSVVNNTTSDVEIWSVSSSAARGTLIRTGTTQLRVPAKSSVTSFFNQFRICPSSGCRLSAYPLSLVVARNDSPQHTYRLLLPGMGSIYNACGNLHLCRVTLRLEGDGRIYYSLPDTVDGRVAQQPEGFPAEPTLPVKRLN